MIVIESKEFKKRLKSKKLQKKHRDRINRILKVLVSVDCFQDLEIDSRAKLYEYERLKYSLNAYFSFRVDNKLIRLIVKPNTIDDYKNLKLEKEVLIVDISFEHYKDISRLNR